MAGRSRVWVAGLVALLVVAVAGWLVLRDDTHVADVPDGRPTQGADGAREARLKALLDELAAGLGRGTTSSLATPAAQDRLAAIDDNVRHIGFSTLELRYVAPAERGADEASPPGTWTADVQVTWQFEYDAARAMLEVPVMVSDAGEKALFAGIAPPTGSDRVPLWLQERLGVRKADRAMVLAADPKRLPVLLDLARTAVPAVSKVLPDWQGSLVLEEPSSQQALNTAVGAAAETTQQLAGLTTTVDGSVGKGAATHVLLNPEVFGKLGPRAAQIVVTHETAHVATDGAVSGAPQWLVEGFADYVALRDLDVPVSVSAGQILDEVRKSGPPSALPTSSDFGGASANLGATYESAWLACRLIAEEYGEDALVEFYRQSDEAGSSTDAFRDALGTTEAAFTRSWSAYLRDLASAS